MIARGTDVVEFHASVSSSLLRLEIHRVVFLASRTLLNSSRESRIVRDIGGDASCLGDVGAELVAVCARVVKGFSVIACFANKEQSVRLAIFFGVEEVRAFLTEVIGNVAAFTFALARGGGCRC